MPIVCAVYVQGTSTLMPITTLSRVTVIGVKVATDARKKSSKRNKIVREKHFFQTRASKSLKERKEKNDEPVNNNRQPDKRAGTEDNAERQ